ncbi:MAG: response regulator, partial [Bacteroidota bacterium]|nr:response regulator [Bacteroidota bacterium]
GFFAIEEDITKDKESESQFRNVLEKIGDNVWEHDYRSGKTTFSKSNNEILGFPILPGEDNRDIWWNQVYPQDLPLLIENDRKYRNREIDSHTLEYRIFRKDGHIRWVLDRGVVIDRDAQNAPLRITGTHTDITARKNAEQRMEEQRKFYEDILNRIPSDIAVFNIHHEYLFINPGGIRDEQVRKWIIGKTDKEYCAYRNKPLYLAEQREAAFQHVLKSKKTAEWEENLVGEHGRREYYLRRMVPVLNSEGEVYLVIGYGFDITERKNLEEELIRAREVAERMAKAKEIFLANMSHEIRTPMNAIMGMGNQLEKTPLTVQQENYLKIINTAAQNLLVIINDILDLSKIEAGKLSVEKIGFDLKKVIGNAMQVLIPRAEEKGLQFTNARAVASLAGVLIGDPFRLTQVLLNLLSNAIKFTEKGSVDISYDLIWETPHTQIIRFEIVDTGIGMDPEFVSKIFDKFNQEYESISRQFGGTGLGMAISKQLIELMHGSIEVRSIKGKGTLVSFTIEFAKGTPNDLPVERTETITRDFLKGKSIMVADDNEMNRLVAIAILENYGATIIAAGNGEEALLELERQPVDLILMDIQMPRLNGYDATAQIRKMGNPIPIIALTANAIKGESEKCIRAGMNDYISKPFKEADFLKVISHWLNAEPQRGSNSPVKEMGADPLYDLSTLKEVARGNQAFVDKMVQVFCDQTPDLVARLREAFQSGDLKTMG